MAANISLILGGAWSGKTSRAALVAAQSPDVTWIGTAAETVPELAEHIHALRSERPPHWHHIAAPFELSKTLISVANSAGHGLIVVDSISQWLSNEIARHAARHDDEQIKKILTRDVEELCEIFVGTLKHRHLLLVSSDFGQSPPPQDSHQRILRMSVGTTNTKLAALAQRVEIVMAGLVVFAKDIK